jgi:hypothetical protein
MALRITEQGLEAIDVDGEAEVAPKQTSVRPGSRPQSRSTRSRGHRLPQAGFRCNAEVGSEEASPEQGKGKDQGWLAA